MQLLLRSRGALQVAKTCASSQLSLSPLPPLPPTCCVSPSLAQSVQGYSNTAMPTPTNTAAWLTAEKARPLEVKSAPYTSPEKDEIVVKNAALGLNLVDWARQDFGTMRSVQCGGMH